MIDPDYFRSRQFVVAGIVALLIMAGGAASVAYTGVGGTFLDADAGCRPLDVPGAAVESYRMVASSNGGRARDEEHTLPAADVVRVDACLAVGELLVLPSEDDGASVHVRVRSDAAQATNVTQVEVRFSRTAEGVSLVLWQPRVGRASGPFGGDRSAETTVEVRVPVDPRLDLRASVHVGHARVTDLAAERVSLLVDVGDVRVLRTDLSGPLDARVDVGNVLVQLDSVQSGTLDVDSDVGDVEIRLPTRADVGYDVLARSGVGGVDVAIGETEHYSETNDPPGSTVEARSRGFDAKPTKVRVETAAQVGSILVKT